MITGAAVDMYYTDTTVQYSTYNVTLLLFRRDVERLTHEMSATDSINSINSTGQRKKKRFRSMQYLLRRRSPEKYPVNEKIFHLAAPVSTFTRMP